MSFGESESTECQEGMKLELVRTADSEEEAQLNSQVSERRTETTLDKSWKFWSKLSSPCILPSPPFNNKTTWFTSE